MKFQFIGTGAADWDWKNFPEGTRGSTSTLIDGHILIDAGETILKNLQRSAVDPAKITHIFITHAHSDHYNIGQIGKIAEMSGHDIDLYGSARVAEEMANCRGIRPHVLEIGEAVNVNSCDVIAIPANHLLERDETEAAHHFILKTPEFAVLYALDGGWMTARARRIISREKYNFRMIVWDATCGNQYHNFRFAEHNDLEMIDCMRESMVNAKWIQPDTLCVFDHIARTLWPETPEERWKLAAEHNGIVVEDGQILELNGGY